MKGRAGVYKITNLITNKIYIGSSIDLESRRIGHFEKGQHNSYLRKAFKRDGLKSFTFEILEHCDPLRCIEREQYYFDTLLFAQQYITSKRKDSRFRKLSYNISPTAGSNYGTKPSINTRRKWSKIRKGRFVSEETKAKMSKSQKAKIKLRGCGYTKGHSVSEKTRVKISVNNGRGQLGRKRPIELVEKFYKPIIQIDLNGNSITQFKSIQQASNELKIGRSSITNVLIGLAKTGGGFKWSYA